MGVFFFQLLYCVSYHVKHLQMFRIISELEMPENNVFGDLSFLWVFQILLNVFGHLFNSIMLSEIMAYLSAGMNQDGFIYWRSHCPWASLKVLFNMACFSKNFFI